MITVKIPQLTQRAVWHSAVAGSWVSVLAALQLADPEQIFKSTAAELTCREWNLGWTEGHGNVLQVSSIIYPSRYFLALWAPYYLSLAH